MSNQRAAEGEMQWSVLNAAMRRGAAICPSCTEEHPEAGAGAPWSETPRCRACGAKLVMPREWGGTS